MELSELRTKEVNKRGFSGNFQVEGARSGKSRNGRTKTFTAQMALLKSELTDMIS